MEKIRQHFSKIKIPVPSDKVYKDECMYSFDSPDSPDGLYLCFNTFLGFGKDYVRDYSTKTGNCIFLHRKRTKIEIPSEKESEPDKKIARLAIGVEGGFNPDAGAKKYEYSTALAVVILPEHDVIALPNDELPELVKQSVQAIESAEGAVQKYNAQISEGGAWDGEVRQITKHADNLLQLDIGVKIPPSGWKCSMCDLTDNLWLNLTDGTICCGRRQMDGSGGNNHAVEHYSKTQYPLAVKLGTITPDGKADVYSYSEDDMVIDPHLEKHLAHFGINVKMMEKTEKTMAELEIDYNQRVWEYSRLTESGQKLVPVFGPGFTGLQNLGNSCYINSVLQVLMSVPSFIERFYTNGKDILSSANPANIPEDLDAQMSKVAVAMLSGKYSVTPPNFTPDAEYDLDEVQAGIAPSLLRSLVGRRHPEFSTKKQQDAMEYLQHLLKLIERSSLKNGKPDPGNCFKFAVEDKFECSVSGCVKYVNRSGGDIYLPLPVPLEQCTNKQQVEDFNKRKQLAEAQGVRFTEDNVRSSVPFAACLSKFVSPETIEAFSSAANARVNMTKTTKLTSFPDYLFIQLVKFGISDTWEPVKYDVSVCMPEQLDLSVLKSAGPQPGENIMPEPTEAEMAPIIPNIDENVVQQLVEMGFPFEGCRKAVHYTGNTGLNAAVDWVMQHIGDEDFSAPLVLGSTAAGRDSSFTPNPESLMMLESMGFTAPQARLALKETQNDLERAADWLFSRQPDLEELVAREEAGEQVSEEAASANQRPNYTDGQPKYELVGFISHMGTSIHVGHYVCHIKKNGQWTIFNDNKVSKSVDPPLDLGYLYLYKRVSA